MKDKEYVTDIPWNINSYLKYLLYNKPFTTANSLRWNTDFLKEFRLGQSNAY